LIYKAMDDDHAYQIPYRSLIPINLDNALVVGRGISADHEALAAIRVMTISMAVGQAAGTAAALVCKVQAGNVSVRSLNRQALQTNLAQNGAILK